MFYSQVGIETGKAVNQFFHFKTEFPLDQLTNNSAAFVAKTGANNFVTLLLAKTSERYRIQADSMLLFNVVVEELVERLAKHYQKNKQFGVSFSSPLPVTQVMEYVSQHFSARQEVIALEV